MYDNLPYTNYHELNLDWIITQVKKAVEEYKTLEQRQTDLENYVNDYFSKLNVGAEVKKVIDAMYADGTIAAIVNASFGARLNIAQMVTTLSGATLKDAVDKSLRVTKKLYIPAGTYDIDTAEHKKITLNQEHGIDILADSKAVFKYENSANSIFYFWNCKGAKFTGGKFIGAGTLTEMLNVSEDGYERTCSNIKFLGCSDIEVSHVAFENTRKPCTTVCINCNRVNIHDCTSTNSVLFTFRFVNHCTNVKFENNNIHNVVRPTNTSDLIDYCYAVVFGLDDLKAKNIVPPENINIINNYVNTSEDSAIDCHGGANVNIVNNTVVEAPCAITCYNDTNRSTRPAGWIMTGVNIINNRCSSNNPGNGKHPFILIANSNKNARDQFNYVIKNNYFKTVNNSNDYGYSPFPINRITNAIIANNVFDCMNSSRYFIESKYLNNCTMSDNVCINSLTGFTILIGQGCSINVKRSGYVTATKSFNTFFTSDNFFSSQPQFYNTNAVTADRNIQRDIGICATTNIEETQLMDYQNGILTSPNAINFVPGMRIDAGSNALIVDEVLSDYSVKCSVYPSGSIANGKYTCKAHVGTFQEIVMA